MPLIILTLIVECCFIYHVFKTGRPAWWAFVILGAPLIGCIAYYFIEIFPGSREHVTANRATRNFARALNPDKELKRRLEAVEISPTVENKLALAQEWLRFGRAQEAIDLYREARTGPHADDPDLALGLASACVAAGDFAQARSLAEELRAKHGKFRQNDVALLNARALEGLGEDTSALDEYERLAATAVGLEPKVRYGRLLKRLGHETQARSVFEEVLAHAKRFNVKHEEEQAWLSLARKELAQLPAV
jgi:hypothetical protein